MKKGFIHTSTIIIANFFIILSLLSILNLISYRINFERFYIFYQGSFLAESFVVKIENGSTSNDLKITSVPFQNTDPPKEVGKSYLSTTYIYSSTSPYKYIFKTYIEYNTSIQKYKIFSKYSEWIFLRKE